MGASRAGERLKLNEIVAALQGASNRLINVEDLTETEIRLLHESTTRAWSRWPSAT